MRPTAVLVVVVVALLAGCETPKSFIEVPSCADKVALEGQATRLSSTRFQLDHTFDLPFSRTVVDFAGPKGASEHRYEIVDSEPDVVRMFVGGAAGVVGALLIGSALYDVANGRDFFQERPFYETVWGSGLVGVALVGIGTGWHPPQQALVIPDDVCPAQARTSPASPSSPSSVEPHGEVFER